MSSEDRMKVLFIDPGNERSAYALWDGNSVEADIFPNEAMRTFLEHEALQAADVVAIEMVASYGMPVGREVFDTVVWIGRFYEQALRVTGREPRLVFRKDIKMHHCLSNTAKDSNIRRALIDKYGEPGTKKNPGRTYGLAKDMWAAFAGATFLTETAKA